MDKGGIMRVRLKPVALTVISRLWWVLRLTARQSNSMLEPTNACEPNVVRLERRCGSANRYTAELLVRAMVVESSK